MQKTEHSFTTILSRYFSLLLLLLLAGLLFWTYISISTTLQKQQQLNINLNNKNSAGVLDATRQTLCNTLQQVTTAFSQLPVQKSQNTHEQLTQVIKTTQDTLHLDLVRFITADQQQIISADSPFFTFHGSEQLFRQDKEKYIDTTHLLSFGTPDNPLWLFITGKRVIQKESGKVLGILIGGIVINDNIPLAREILQHSNAEYAVLQIDGHLLSSNRPLPASLRNIAERTSIPLTRSSKQITGKNQQMVISRYEYTLGNDQSLFVLLFYKDTMQMAIQQSFLRSGAILFLATACLFFLFFQLSRKQISKAMVNLVDYTRQAAESTEKSIYTPGKLLEFNQVGTAVEKMLGQLDKSRKQLAAERERLTVTLRSIGDAVITTDIEGKIVFLNKVAEELTEWSNDEALGVLSTEVFHIINEKTGEKSASPVQRVLEQGRIIGLANHTALISKNGRKRSIADSGAPIRDRKSKIIGVVIVFRDITQERQMEEELLKVRKLESIGILAGGLAHDFNNLLAAILGNIELTASRIAGQDKEAAILLDNAEKATMRAARLTKQLLTFSKGGDPVREMTSLPELIRDSADFVLHGSQLYCTYQFPEDLWVVDVDSGQLSQVIQNLIINAKHAMPEGGKIEICGANTNDLVAKTLLSTHQGPYVSISIKDSGIGIPKEIVDKIFDPYFTTKQEGSGLGLAICHSIINKHDGYLTVKSKPGDGTTFTIHLPAIPDASDHQEKKQILPSAVTAKRIMIMDDEEMLCEMAMRQLSILGHTCITVSDGEQAINKYQASQDEGTPVDLVIMDLTIPGGLGGKETASRLLKIDPLAKMIVVSGYSNDPVMANYQEYGFLAAMAKPFSLTILNKVIEKACA